MSKIKFARQTKSTRELRRMGQREKDREKRMEDVRRFWELPPEVRAQRMADNAEFARIQKNGITLEDMKKAEDKAYRDGVDAGTESMMKMCYAGICLTMHELYGFGHKRCLDVLKALDDKLVYALTGEDLVNEVLEKFSIQIHFKNDIGEDRVQEASA